MTDDKWYLAGDGSAGRWDSGDADADRAALSRNPTLRVINRRILME